MAMAGCCNPPISQVALVQGEDRAENVRAAVAAVIDELPWASYQRVVVKPNLVVYDAPFAVTHRDALAVVLELIRARYAGKLTIAEGCAYQSTAAAFRFHKYDELARRYDCALVDLNADEVAAVEMLRRNGDPVRLRVARTILQSDCRVSLTLPKTHDAVQVTLSIKNMIMASLVNRRNTSRRARPNWLDWLGKTVFGHGAGWGSDKAAMHQQPVAMNLNLARLAPLVWPQLAVIDGYVAMEGAGPITGAPVDWRIAMASTDALALDVTALQLMGFRLQDIGYLHHCSTAGLGNYLPGAVRITTSTEIAALQRCFAPHPTTEQQRQWRQVGDPSRRK
jgi:uncharacterized protein (DUF362 family)